MSTYDTLNNIVEFDKTQSAPLPNSAMFMHIKGYPAISLQIQTGQMPMPKVASMEYTTNVGTTLGAKGGVQMWQQIPLSFLERESIETKKEIVRAIGNAYKDKNNITVEFWVGDMRSFDSQKWGTVKFAHFTSEEGVEFDVESKDSPTKISGVSLEGWYQLESCEEADPTIKANALSLLDKMKAFREGTEDC